MNTKLRNQILVYRAIDREHSESISGTLTACADPKKKGMHADDWLKTNNLGRPRRGKEINVAGVGNEHVRCQLVINDHVRTERYLGARGNLFVEARNLIPKPRKAITKQYIKFYPAYYILLNDVFSLTGATSYWPDALASIKEQLNIIPQYTVITNRPLAYGYGMATFANDDQLDGGNLNIPDDWGSDLWAAHYNAILNLNAAISAMKKGSLGGIDETDKNILMAQARMLRGYNYFMLVRMFGGVPLMTDDIDDPFQAKPKRAEVSEVYQLITDDLTYAYQNLPTSWSPDKKGRPTSDAAKALLAKAYLTMATFPLNQPDNYKKAADLAAQVIADGRYSLVSDINEVFSVATKYGPEMMWSFNSNYNDLATDPQIWTDMDGWGDESADPIWVQNYPDQPRKYAYIQVDNFAGDSYLDLGNLPGVKKYLYGTMDDFDAGRSIINIPIIRYADVLLIFAEADNMANGHPSQAGVEAINQIINRANDYQVNAADPLATVSMTKEDFDTKVIQERNLELCFEYDRWFDLIRKHILKQMSDPDIQQNFSDDDYLFPIPSTDIRLNPNLTQNPGYN